MRPLPPARADVGQAAASQVAALCWRLADGAPEVLLITSRDTGRWVIPKGWPITGLSAAEAAAREAWEEAGVVGQVSARALGCYDYHKITRAAKARRCRVAVFPLEVEILSARFPEAEERNRRWFPAAEAAALVAEAELRALLEAVAQDPALLAPTAP